jgi:hypothetical protein
LEINEDEVIYACEKHNYRQLDLIDLKLDYEELKGKWVSLSGVGTYLADQFFIGEEFFGNDIIAVDFSRLPRNQRKFIMTQCAEGCNVTVYGLVDDSYYTYRILAEGITKD